MRREILIGTIAVALGAMLAGCERDTPRKASAAVSRSVKPAPTAAPLEDGELMRFSFDGTTEGLVSGDLPQNLPQSGFEFIEGVRGQAIRFDGSGTEVEVEKAGTLAIEDQLTLEFWLRYDGPNPIRKSSIYTCCAHSSVFSIGVSPHRNALGVRLATAGDKVRLVGAEGEIAVGNWTHVALVYDGAAARVYVNGEVTASTRASGPVALNPKLAFGIGTWFKTNQALFGAIDELRIWNKAFTAEQIAESATR